ncbi:tryptophan-rich sensory protein TspO [Qingshengfaniella alkalisoli]|uniref:Tryptophan-rich sensory protein n=1 Tax=Qingshengfaniella alkalisoli TaxID=2599296 RepID=A0A5B8IA51_9RHOB|nr:TspO/MBR family protein [Qingshengfaniella alkalisoli]QDY70056.1 tryptophan-rich sensory protein [Qingshengfaniella alkalisoli]
MDWILYFVFLASCAVAGSTGVIFQPGRWYDDLQKPAWTPPKWVFPVVWTTLYILIALAASRVAVQVGSAFAIGLWALQMTLNAIWSPIFFGAHRMRVGLVVIILLWFAVAATAFFFFQFDMLAGLLFLPYLLWVSLASALNLEILRMNVHLDGNSPE